MPAYTITHASDVAFDSFKAQESVAVKSYVDAKKEYDNFQAEYNSADAAGKVRLKESLIQSRMVLEKADQDIQSARQAQTNLTESVMEAAKGQGIDAAKYYTKDLQTEVLKEIKSNNIKNIASIGFSTSLDKFNVKAKAYNPETNKPLVPYTLKPKETINIDLAGYEGKDLPVYSDLDFTYKKKFINTVSAIKRNGKYELFFPPNVRGSANDENYAFIDRLSNKIGYTAFKDLSGKQINSAAQNKTDMPRLNDFKQAVAELVVNKNADISTLPTKLQSKAKEVAENISKKVDKGNITVNQSLDFLYVDKEVKAGTAAKRLLNLTQSLDENLISQGSQYKVYKQDGALIDLPLYLKELGLSYTSEDIDFKNTKTNNKHVLNKPIKTYTALSYTKG